MNGGLKVEINQNMREIMLGAALSAAGDIVRGSGKVYLNKPSPFVLASLFKDFCHSTSETIPAFLVS